MNHARTLLPKIKPFILPTISLIIYIGLAVYLKMVLPPGTDLYELSADFFRTYGYYLVFVGALLEAALVIDLLVPGASIILAAAFFTSQGVLSYPLFFILAFCGAFLGFLFDYLVGYYSGFKLLNWLGLSEQLNTIEQRVKKWGLRAFLLGYIHPDLGSLYAVSAGALRLDLKLFLFYSGVSIAFWGLFWSLPIYLFGDFIKIYFKQYTAVAIILIIIVIFLPKIVNKLIKEKELIKFLRKK
jgi:membrane protein DedA with SNARE-associated domain